MPPHDPHFHDCPNVIAGQSGTPLGIPMLPMSFETGLKWNGALGTQPKWLATN
jgi:hypothetical protein